jgi:hypothetical protein
MEKKNKLLSKVMWSIFVNPHEASLYVKNSDEFTPLPPEILNMKLRGKHIAMLSDWKEGVYLTTPFIGNTFKDWMNCLYEGVNKTIIVKELSREQVKAIYKRIGEWFDSKDRLRLVKDLESNKLKVIELVGNHYFFEGNLKLNKGVWTYSVGS